tara:strand:+ start:1562 stop:2875 length:1314 start_codon:yes stop_codon:yes gene_type:complete
MATAGGPKIVTDGLVFGYDTNYGVADNDTTTRFYTGAPTINYIHGQNAVAQDSYTAYSATSSGTWDAKHPNAIRAYNAQGGDITGYVNTGVTDWTNTYHAVWELDPILKKPVVVMNDVSGQWKAKSYSTGIGSWTSQGKSHGDTYTISWLQWVDNLSKNAKAGLYTKNTSGGNGFHDGQANSASSYNTETHTWQRVYQTYTTSSVRDLNNSQATVYMYGQYNVRATVKIADVQFTWGSIPVPFSEVYERSSTASLIDLKETTDIDVSNVSFDSTGQPTFDGTDDIIDLTLPQNFQDELTIETWYKGTDSSRNHLWNFTGSGNLNCNFNDGSYTLWLYWDGGGSNYLRFTTPQFCDSEIHHIVFVHEGSTNKVYLDGVLLTNGVAGGTQTFNSKIGSTYDVGGSPYFQGDVYVNRVYDKALTASQVQQNYNAQKNRFA